MLVLLVSRQALADSLSRYLPTMYRLSLQGWYLTSLTNQIAKKFLSLSHLVAKLDQKVLPSFVRYSAISYVLLAHVVAWLDRQLIGGIINILTGILHGLGKLYLPLQKGNLQHYFWGTLVGICLLLVCWWLLGY